MLLQVPFSDDLLVELPQEEPAADADGGTAQQETWSSVEVRAPDFGPQRSDVAR